jgi:hypothetical protein
MEISIFFWDMSRSSAALQWSGPNHSSVATFRPPAELPDLTLDLHWKHGG